MPRLSISPLLALSALGSALSAGPVKPGEYRSGYFLDRVHHSQEILFTEVVRHYDSLLAVKRNPAIHIEKCKFMESALYDAESEENPKSEAADSCYQELLKRYPDDGRVLAFHLQHLYGDSVIATARAALDRIPKGTLVNADTAVLAAIHLSLARAYDNLDSARTALDEYRAALRYDDTLELSLAMARQMAALGQKDPALTALLRGEARMLSWEYSQAGDLLLRLGYPKHAARFYGKNLGDTTKYINYEGLAKALEKSGEIDSARIIHAKTLGNSYGKVQARKRQFEFDLRHSSGPVAAASYRDFRDLGFKMDPFAFYRLKLFVLHPFQRIMLRDLGGLGLLILALAALLLAPYLWVLPLFYVGSRWFARSGTPRDSRFNLKHMWICSAALLIASFLATGFFRHHAISHALGSVAYGTQNEVSEWENALFLASFSGLMFVFAVAFVRATGSQFLFRPMASPARTLCRIAGCLALVYMVRRLNLAVFPEDPNTLRTELLEGSVIALLKSCLGSLGYAPTILIAAGMVPLYEELLFRAVFQESLGKYLPFWIVNLVQASVFAGLHDSLRQFPTLFAMGLALGWLARKSGSLLAPMLMHAANNLIAVSALWLILEKLSKTR